MKKIVAALVAVLMMLAATVSVGAQPSPAQAGGSIPRIADITPVHNGVRIRFTAFDGAHLHPRRDQALHDRHLHGAGARRTGQVLQQL